MSDLISRKALLEEVKSLTMRITGLRAGKGVLSEYMQEYKKSVLRSIEEQPTAYNVEKVVQQLEDVKSEYEQLANNSFGNMEWQEDIELLAKAEMCEYALGIVRGGNTDVPQINVGNNGWIPVEKELPNVGITVLCYWKKVNRYNNSTDFFYTLMHRNADVEWISDFGKCTGEVIAWQVLVPYVGEN